MSVRKQYLKTKPLCKVTFSMSKEKFNQAEDIKLIGEFNQWDIGCQPMKKQKNGKFSQTVDLEPGKEYQYRLLINGNEWLNDPEAEKYVPNEFASENSVVVI